MEGSMITEVALDGDDIKRVMGEASEEQVAATREAGREETESGKATHS